MSRIPDYPAPSRMLTGEEPLAAWQDGRQVALPVGVLLGTTRADADRAMAQAAVATMRAGEAQAAAATAQAAVATTDTAKGAVLQAIGQVPAAARLMMPAPTRDILRNFSGMTGGEQAWLGEGLRAGPFEWRVGDYTARVVSDPRFGIYGEGVYIASDKVPVSQGCWCRMGISLPGLPGSRDWRMGWWGIGPGFRDTPAILPVDAGTAGIVTAVQGRVFYYMAKLLPDVCELWYPEAPKDAPILKASATQWGQKSVVLRAHLGATWVSTYEGSACFNDGDGFERLNGSNSWVDGVCYKGLMTTQGQISPACIAIAGGVFANRQGNPVRNVGFKNCWFEAVSAPCICYDSCWSRDTLDGLQRTKGFFARDSVIMGCDYEYQSCYNVEDVLYENMMVACVDSGKSRENYGKRIIGCKNVQVRGKTRIIGQGFRDPFARAFTVASALSPITGVPNAQPIACEGIIFDEGVVVSNVPIVFAIGGRVDGLLCRGIRAVNDVPPTDQTASYATVFARAIDNTDIGEIRFERPYIRGFDAMFYAEGGWIRRWEWIDFDFESVGRSTQPAQGLATMRNVDGYARFERGKVAYPSTAGSPFRFENMPSTFSAEFVGEIVLPEHFYAVGDSRRAKAVGGSGLGTYVTSAGGALQTMVDGRVPDDGTLRFAAAGTWDRIRRDPKPGLQ